MGVDKVYNSPYTNGVRFLTHTKLTRGNDMKLLTKENLKNLPALGSTDGMGKEAIVQVKFFTPWAGWTWYATEYDPETRTFFGLVDGFEKELGYFNLDELESINGPFGLKIERDRGFQGVTLYDAEKGRY